MEAVSHEEIQKHVRKYIVVFCALAALTILTVGASYLNVSTGMHVAIALFIAMIKASLVGAYFMHLISEKSVLYSILVLTVLFFIFLMALPTITDADMVGEETAPALTAPATDHDTEGH